MNYIQSTLMEGCFEGRIAIWLRSSWHAIFSLDIVQETAYMLD